MTHEDCTHHSPPRPGAHHAGRFQTILLLLVVYMIAEIVGGLACHSLALVADAGHMAIDAASVGLALFASWIATKPPTLEKTYGFYRAEILGALINCGALIAVSFWIFFEAYQRAQAAIEIEGTTMLYVSLGGLAVNITCLLLVPKPAKGNLNSRAVWWHIATDTLGSVSAVVASILVLQLRWYRADLFVSILLGLLILYGAWGLLKDCVNVLLEAVPKGIDVAQIKHHLESQKLVKEVHDLHIWTVATGVPALSAHVRIQENGDIAAVLTELTELLKHQHGIDHVTLQVEPSHYGHAAMRI